MKINTDTIILFAIIPLIIFMVMSAIPQLIIEREAIIANVIDGDTITTNKNEIIRILGINTPERNERGFLEAKERMEDLVLDSKVILQCERKDKYGRELCWVYVNVIQIMIPEGHSEYIQPY